MPHKSAQIAIGGLSAALCVTMMVLSAMLPFATYALPALAGIALIPAVVEVGSRSAIVAYAAVSLLSLMVVPDPETALMFVAFFGYYPILKFRLDRMVHPIFRMTLKLLLFNVSMVLAYQVVIRLFGMVDILDEFGGPVLMALTLGIGNIGFILYDRALVNVTQLYVHWFRKKYLRR